MTGRRTFGSTRKLRSGSWQASYWHEGKRYVGPGTFESKSDANAWLSSVEASIRQGAWIDPEAGKVSFRDYANAWLATRPDLRPRSTSLYRSLLDRHLIPIFGTTPISRVTPSRVRTWHAALVAEWPGAAASAYRLLRAIFASAVHDEVIVRSPCRVPKGGMDRAMERPMLTVAEVQALEAAMPVSLRAAVTLAAWGALRRGEVLALRRRDVDPLRETVRVERSQVELDDGSILFGPPKTEAGVRRIHLPEGAMRAVVEHLDSYVSTDGDTLLFTGRGGVPMRPRTLSTAFRAARARCGLPDARFHDLRHFALTMAATTGASTKELMRRAGHASPDAALRYQHATEDRDKAIADALTALANRADVLLLSPSPKESSRT
jgi:integrase